MDAPVTIALLDCIIRDLAPLFLDAVRGDQEAANAAVDEIICRAMPSNDTELMMVAQTIALNSHILRAAVSARTADLPERERLRFHQVSTRLASASTRLHLILERRRAARRAAAAGQPAAAQSRKPAAAAQSQPAPATPDRDREAATRIAEMIRNRAEAIIGAPPPDDIDLAWREQHGPPASETTLPGMPPNGKPQAATKR